ncbi:hypothetical protein AB7M42_005169 [Bradyrhizobium diazoefficiens]
MFARYLKKLAPLLALLLMTGITPAAAQQQVIPGITLPPQTVIGNMTSFSGNAVAVSMAQLRANMTLPIATTCPSSNWFNSLSSLGVLGCTQPAVNDISGFGSGVANLLVSPSSANLRAALTDETGTGLAYFQGGDIGTPSAGVGTNLTALNASNLGSGTVAAARGGAGTITGALKGNGAGVVSQAACADLSNGTALCSTTPGTNVATALANGANANGGIATTTGSSTAWTPTITTSGTVGTPAYSTNNGVYEKVGNTVNVFFNIQLSGWTGSPTGNVSIAGLPIAAGGSGFGTCNITGYSGVLSIGWVSGVPSSSTIILEVIPQTGATGFANLTAANAGTTFAIKGGCSYPT